MPIFRPGLMLVAAIATAAGAGANPPQDVGRGLAHRPHFAEGIGGLPENTIYLYWDQGASGRMHQIHPVTSQLVGRPHDFEDQHFLSNIRDDMSSVQWNLPPGVVVVLYEDKAGRGEQLVLWGKGRSRSLDRLDFDDKVSRWAWFHVGGATRPPVFEITPPYGTSHLTSALKDSIEILQHTDLGGRMAPIANITAHEPAALHKIPNNLGDKMSSLRWSLPPGVVVIFTENASGSGRQLGIWGSAESPRLLYWDFNDKASRWSWFYVGDREAPQIPQLAAPKSACPHCGLQVALEGEIHFCPYCGSPWEAARVAPWRFCPLCGCERPEDETWSFCPDCGEPWGSR